MRSTPSEIALVRAVDTQKLFETEWVHVFTVKSGKITRWRGFLIRAVIFA
jgi:ketosteroid isomerase-like protein